MKVATNTKPAKTGRSYNKIIMTLFVVVILLFGLLAGLYVVNQRVTVQNRAAEPVLPSGTNEEPFIECRWDAEEGVDYTYRITEENILTGAVSVLPEQTLSLDDGASSGANGIETSSSDGNLSVIYRNVQPGSEYMCEVYVGGPKCGEATLTYSSGSTITTTGDKVANVDTLTETSGAAGGTVTTTLTPSVTPTGTISLVIPGSSDLGTGATATPTLSSLSLSSSFLSGTSPTPTSSAGSENNNGSGLSATSTVAPTGLSSTGSASPTGSGSSVSPTSSLSSSNSSSTGSPTLTSGSISSQSDSSGGGVVTTGTHTPTPPVSGIATASLLLLFVGVIVIGLGLLL